MVNQVKVNPERNARQAAATTAVATVGRRVGQFARRVVSNGARVLEHTSRLYGYAILIAGVDAIHVTGVSSLPLTKWDGEFVPHADNFVVSVVLGVWLAVSGVESRDDLKAILAHT